MNTPHVTHRIAARALALVAGTTTTLAALVVGAGAASARPLQPDDAEVTGTVTTIVRDTASPAAWQIATIALAAALFAVLLALAVSAYRHHHVSAATAS